jgi:hydrogenase-4 component B
MGVLPQFAIGAAARVTGQLLNQTVRPGSTLWWIAPVAPEQASYSGLILLVGIVAVVSVTLVLVRLLAHGRVRRTNPWDCGYPWQTSRMQDTAEGFGQPIRHMFGIFFRMERDMPSPTDSAPRYRIYLEDRLWRGIYLPIARGVQGLADAIGILQGGRLAIYLVYSFLTLLGLLVFVL